MLLVGCPSWSLFKVRCTWAIVGVLVALQAPVMFAVNDEVSIDQRKPGRPADRATRAVSSSETVHDNSCKPAEISATTGRCARTKGITIQRQLLKSGSFDRHLDQRPGKLEGLEGVDAISVDAPVFHRPFLRAAHKRRRNRSLEKASDLRATRSHRVRPDAGKGDWRRGDRFQYRSRIKATWPQTSAAFFDFTQGQSGVATQPVDGYGHSAHVAGLVAGSGGRSNGQWGVAPSAPGWPLRVLDNSGSGSTSDVIASSSPRPIASPLASAVNTVTWPPGIRIGSPWTRSVRAVEAASRAGIVVVRFGERLSWRESPQTKLRSLRRNSRAGQRRLR